MNEQTAWQRFVQTGTVEDYLEYTRYRSAESLQAPGVTSVTGEGLGNAVDRPRDHHSGEDLG